MSWSRDLSQSYSSVLELSQAGLITPLEAKKLEHLGERFQIRITPYYAGLMKASEDCPIRKQAIPALGEEDPELPSWATDWSMRIYGRPAPWTADAIGDIEKLAAPRLTHRYGNRAILHLSSLCAMYCRFCFRKSHLNDDSRTLYEGSLDPALTYLSETPSIQELILTGGDPLSLTDAALERLLDRLNELKHLKVVRFHSRMAVTLPSRLTNELAATLSKPRGFLISLVSHFNHPNEWTQAAREGLARMRRAGIALYNQNVLLAGINDSVECLRELYQGLYHEGVTPFYLHHPDWTPGTFHFRVSVEKGQHLMRALQGVLSGPALPRYVLDIPQGSGKTSLVDGTVRKIDELTQGPIQGAVYEVSLPQTRSSSASELAQTSSTTHYLDLFHA